MIVAATAVAAVVIAVVAVALVAVAEAAVAVMVAATSSKFYSKNINCLSKMKYLTNTLYEVLSVWN